MIDQENIHSASRLTSVMRLSISDDINLVILRIETTQRDGRDGAHLSANQRRAPIGGADNANAQIC
jgi:hypothetical protein